MSNFYTLLMTPEAGTYTLKLNACCVVYDTFIKHQYGARGKNSSPKGEREDV